jgi:type I restriction enzyme S subunit
MEDKRKVPEIRFKGFSGEWEERKLGEIYNKIRNAFVGTASPYYVEDGHFYLESNNVKNGQINRNTEIFINEDFYQKQKDTWLHTGDIVMVQSGHVGHSAVIPPSLNNTAAHALIYFTELKQDANPYFLNYQFQHTSAVCQFEKITTGNTIKHILSSNMKEFIVSVPIIAEQNFTAEFFKNLDSLITLHQRKYEKLTTVKKAMLEKMFPKDGTDVPEIRFKGFTAKWERRQLGEIAEFTKGSGYSKKDLSEHGTPIILYGRLYTKYQVIIDDVDTFVIAKNGSVYSKGHEVIVPASGETTEDIARASAVVKAGILLGGDLNVVYPNENINPVFLALSISNGEQCKELSKKAKGKSVVHIHNSDLKEVSILYPRVAEQSQIGTFFQNLDSLITLQQRELDKLKNIKKACLEKMFV